MSRLLIAVLFAAVAILPTAQAEAEVLNQEEMALCKIFADFAKVTMDARQHDAPMHDAMAIAVEADTAANGSMMSAIVSDAYKTPIYLNDDVKVEVAESFRDQIFGICFESYMKNR